MSKRQLPKLESVQARDGLSFDLPKSAVNKWKPELHAKADDATITVYDVIGRDEYGGVSAKRISSALRAIGNKDVTVLINSPGGDVFEGIAIYNLLREHPANVTVRVIGLAASAASLVAMAGDKIEMGRAAFMMVHNVWVLAIGNRNDLREYAEFLEPFDDALADVYAARSGMEKKKVAKLMDSETWMNGTQAVESGFADDLLAADAVEQKDDAKATARYPDAAALVRGIDATLLKNGTRRDERVALVEAARNMFSSSKPNEPIGSPVITAKEIDTMTPENVTPVTPAAAAPAANTPAAPTASAIADAVKADRARGTAIMALDEAKGREKLAQTLVNKGTSVEDAKEILGASPKSSKLDAAMSGHSPGISSQEQGEQMQKKAINPADVYAKRAKQVEASRVHGVM